MIHTTTILQVLLTLCGILNDHISLYNSCLGIDMTGRTKIEFYGKSSTGPAPSSSSSQGLAVLTFSKTTQGGLG